MGPFAARLSAHVPAAALLLAALGPGCGGGAPPAPTLASTCGKVDPCGGDPTGDWTIATSCQMGLKFDFTVCADAYTIDASGLATTGTFSMNADKTYSVATSSGGSFAVTFPASCLAGQTCADILPSVQSVLAQEVGPGLGSVTCAGSGACVCTVFPNQTSTNESGNWAASGTSLTTMATGSTTATTFGYCVDGKTMHLMMLDPGIVYDIIAQRP
jgi:hypothetical protein